jgi:hypothetical protein
MQKTKLGTHFHNPRLRQKQRNGRYLGRLNKGTLFLCPPWLWRDLDDVDLAEVYKLRSRFASLRRWIKGKWSVLVTAQANG